MKSLTRIILTLSPGFLKSRVAVWLINTNNPKTRRDVVDYIYAYYFPHFSEDHFQHLPNIDEVAKEMIRSLNADDKLNLISRTLSLSNLLGKNGLYIYNDEVIQVCRGVIEKLIIEEEIIHPVAFFHWEIHSDINTTSKLLDFPAGFEKVLLALADPVLDNDDHRKNAAEILGIMDKREALPDLVQALDRIDFQPVYRAIRDSIIAIGNDAETITELSAILLDQDNDEKFVRYFERTKHASFILATWGDSKGYDFLKKGLKYGQLVYIEAAEMLAKLGTEKSVEILAEALQNETASLSRFLEFLDDIPLPSSREAIDSFFRQLELDLKNKDASKRIARAKQCMYGNNKSVLPIHIVQMAEQVLGR